MAQTLCNGLADLARVCPSACSRLHSVKLRYLQEHFVAPRHPPMTTSHTAHGACPCSHFDSRWWHALPVFPLVTAAPHFEPTWCLSLCALTPCLPACCACGYAVSCRHGEAACAWRLCTRARLCRRPSQRAHWRCAHMHCPVTIASRHMNRSMYTAALSCLPHTYVILFATNLL
jgi:hypothetical protein